jgi:hypothetical protein
MKTLTIEHLSAYLPYGVNVMYESFNGDVATACLNGVEKYGNTYDDEWDVYLGDKNVNSGRRDKRHDVKIKPLLRPLSQLTETIEHNGERLVPSLRIDDMGCRVHSLTYDGIGVFALPYWVVCELHHFHFDTFGLIESGLAEPIPSIPQ